MTTVTIKIQNEKDLLLLQEVLDKFGFNYHIDKGHDDAMLKNNISDLLQTKQDFLDGKICARKWSDIEDDLNRAYN